MNPPYPPVNRGEISKGLDEREVFALHVNEMGFEQSFLPLGLRVAVGDDSGTDAK